MTHSPEQLNFVLVDFKGGATFAGMADMPHVSAVITNLGQELTLVDRMQDALSGEMVRRQELLRDGRQLRLGHATTRRPAPPASAARAAAVAVHRGRRVLRDALGQAGVHRPVRRDRPARPLARRCTCCSPRSGSRRAGCAGWSRTCPTGSACAPSRPASRARCSACPTPTSCPPVPGPGLPQARPDHAAAVQGGLRVRAADGPRRAAARDEGGALARHPAVHASPRCTALERAGDRARRPRAAAGRSPGEQRVAARHRRRAGWSATGRPAHQVWLPPLDVPDTLDELLRRPRRAPRARAWCSPAWRDARARTCPLGIVDRPREQRRDTLTCSTCRRGRPRRGRRRPAPRQEHAAAHASSRAWR